jgi:DNA processing protein
MNRLEALIGLNMVLDIGSIRLKKLLEYFDKPQDILKASLQKLRAVSGIGEKIAENISALRDEDLEREFTSASKLGLKVITHEDIGYPENLKNIPDPPIVLYVKGQLKDEDKFSIAIVGSRRASYYGLSCAKQFAADLVDHGFVIVSGMARGIDTYAHRGALSRGKRTIAVMGSGFNHIYPPENRELAQEISRNGAVISEFPLNTRPLPQNFPRRNRLISGLSLGTVVVEAARNSGALITADFALEQGRDVFALPGKVGCETSFGTNELIKQGAKLVSCVDDILEEFAFSEPKRENPVNIYQPSGGGCQEVTYLQLGLSQEESFLCGLITDKPLLLDDIVEQANLNVPEVSRILLGLEMKKLIKQLPGKQFVKMK